MSLQDEINRLQWAKNNLQEELIGKWADAINNVITKEANRYYQNICQSIARTTVYGANNLNEIGISSDFPIYVDTKKYADNGVYLPKGRFPDIFRSYDMPGEYLRIYDIEKDAILITQSGKQLLDMLQRLCANDGITLSMMQRYSTGSGRLYPLGKRIKGIGCPRLVVCYSWR